MTSIQLVPEARRKCLCAELRRDYVRGAKGCFLKNGDATEKSTAEKNGKDEVEGITANDFYKLPRIGVLWSGRTKVYLPKHGGAKAGSAARKQERK